MSVEEQTFVCRLCGERLGDFWYDAQADCCTDCLHAALDEDALRPIETRATLCSKCGEPMGEHLVVPDQPARCPTGIEVDHG